MAEKPVQAVRRSSPWPNQKPRRCCDGCSNSDSRIGRSFGAGARTSRYCRLSKFAYAHRALTGVSPDRLGVWSGSACSLALVSLPAYP
jgi:hypothetical protein